MRIASALLLIGGICPAASPMSLEAAGQRIKAAALQAGVSFPLPAVEIRIHKAPHRLELLSAGKLVKQYAVGLGHKGLADKRRQGDHLTPEGRFYVCNRNEQSQFHLFLGISYPGEESAARGLREGLVTKVQHDAILRAVRNKACPSWNTRLGGTVGIHGGGSSGDWTWGCIALEDSEIEELWMVCPVGTPIFIEAQ